MFEDHHHHCIHCLWYILLLRRWDKTIFLFQRHAVKLQWQEKLAMPIMILSIKISVSFTHRIHYIQFCDQGQSELLPAFLINPLWVIEDRDQILKGHLVMVKRRRRRSELIALSLLVLVQNLADPNGGHNLSMLMVRWWWWVADQLCLLWGCTFAQSWASASNFVQILCLHSLLDILSKHGQRA